MMERAKISKAKSGLIFKSPRYGIPIHNEVPTADHTTTNIEKEGSDTASITTKHPYQCLIVMDGPAADQTTTNMGKEGSDTAATTTKETTIEDDSSNEDEDAQSEKASCAKKLRAPKKKR